MEAILLTAIGFVITVCVVGYLLYALFSRFLEFYERPLPDEQGISDRDFVSHQ